MGILNYFTGEGNGCVRFVEIATQTVNLTSVLTNLNSSVTNSNNTSEPCSEQIVSPTILSPNKMNDVAADVIHQSYNQKSNNGHCIIDDTNDDDDDDMNDESKIHISQVQHQQATTPVSAAKEFPQQNVSSVTEAQTTDITHMDGVLKHDTNTFVTTADIGETVVTVTSTSMPTSIPTDIAAVVKTPTDTDSTADETEITKKHASIDGTNGPANDVRV